MRAVLARAMAIVGSAPLFIWGTVPLVTLGFTLFPESPSFPAAVLTLVSVPVALIGAVALPIIQHREARRAKMADAEYYYGTIEEPPVPEE